MALPEWLNRIVALTAVSPNVELKEYLSYFQITASRVKGFFLQLNIFRKIKKESIFNAFIRVL